MLADIKMNKNSLLKLKDAYKVIREIYSQIISIRGERNNRNKHEKSAVGGNRGGFFFPLASILITEQTSQSMITNHYIEHVLRHNLAMKLTMCSFCKRETSLEITKLSFW